MKLGIYISLVFLLANISSPAQNKGNAAVLKAKDHLIGTSLGLWMHSSSAILGVNYEKQLGQLGGGTAGLGLVLRVWSYLEKYSSAEVSYSNTFLGAQGNYNLFRVTNADFIPFGGMVFGYNFISDRYKRYDDISVIAYDKTYKSGILYWVQAGMRYFMHPKVAGSLRLAVGNHDFSVLELGVDIKL
jgi:hypothetical protein